MNIENIIEIFRRLSGVNAEDTVKLRFMCENTFEYVNAHIKSGADIAGFSGRLEFAAAALAYYRYVLWCLTDSGADNIKVGEISVSGSGGKALEAAEKLCCSAFEDIGDVFDNGGFVFERI